MSEEADYFKKKPGYLNSKWAVLSGCFLFLILVGLGYLAVHKPVIVVDARQAGIHVKNTGSTDALIYKVDGFWYWAGKVAFLTNMPGIHQRVEAGADSVRLQIPDIPIPDKQGVLQSAFFMKLAVRYSIPGMPIFRYTAPLYFKYNSTNKTWALTKSIPAKHRAIGNLAIGNVDQIELSFH
ncbi:MAG: hypothetical protein JRE24_03670 [Deltaproteobacteria bacterium]|nr:hypothetical protein [Deltaproteobacteria bacterium]